MAAQGLQWTVPGTDGPGPDPWRHHRVPRDPRLRIAENTDRPEDEVAKRFREDGYTMTSSGRRFANTKADDPGLTRHICLIGIVRGYTFNHWQPRR